MWTVEYFMNAIVERNFFTQNTILHAKFAVRSSKTTDAVKLQQ